MPIQRARDALIRFTLSVEDLGDDDGGAVSDFSRIGDNNPITTTGDGPDDFFFGTIRSFTPPDLKRKNADWPTMGDGQLRVDLGIEDLPFTFVTARYHPAIRGLYGKHVKFNLKAGLWQADTKRHSLYSIECQGDVETVTGSQVTVGDLPEGITVMMNCNKYLEKLGEDVFVNIDIFGLIREMGSQRVNELDEIRAFFGFT